LIGFGWPQAVVALVALQRVGELIHSNRNTRALLARGAIERGAVHYPALVVLHTAWLAALFVLAEPDAVPQWPWLALFAICQVLRVWVVRTLGPYWTTRIIILPGAAPVASGPYRFVRHPNYLIVAVEIPALSLGLGLPAVALAFGVANLLVLALRIAVEDRARATAEG
jgi:methyltransferase